MILSKEWMSESFTSCEPLQWIISKKTLQKMYKNTAWMIHMLHYQVLQYQASKFNMTIYSKSLIIHYGWWNMSGNISLFRPKEIPEGGGAL